jgi:hypothetical protein
MGYQKEIGRCCDCNWKRAPVQADTRASISLR